MNRPRGLHVIRRAGHRLGVGADVAQRFIAALGCILLAGCASVTSKRQQTVGPVEGGVVYFLPRQPIQVQVVISASDQGKAREVSVTSGSAYPDYAHSFVLGTHSSPFANRKINLATDSRGLLTSVNPIITSGVAQALKSIAEPAVMRTEARDQECEAGTYTRLIEPRTVFVDDCGGTGNTAGSGKCDRTRPQSSSVDDLCGLAIEIAPAFPSTAGGLICAGSSASSQTICPADESPARDTTKALSARELAAAETNGIFYRRHLPYRVTVGSGQAKREFIAFSPNESPVYYLPFPASLFASKQAKATLEAGLLTAYDIDEDSEALALLALPAEVIGAYFGAIGKMFDWQKTAIEKEKEYLQTLNRLSVEKLQSENCKSALSAATTVTQEVKSACGLQ